MARAIVAIKKRRKELLTGGTCPASNFPAINVPPQKKAVRMRSVYIMTCSLL
jgi:hypothetical protein